MTPQAPTLPLSLEQECAAFLAGAAADPEDALFQLTHNVAVLIVNGQVDQTMAESELVRVAATFRVPRERVLAALGEWLERRRKVFDLRPPAKSAKPGKPAQRASAPATPPERTSEPRAAEPPDFNSEFAVVSTGNSVLVMRELAGADGRKQTHLMSADAFRLFMANRKVTVGDRRVSAAKQWLESVDRRQYDGICFRPAAAAPAGYLNLWKGFSVAPSAQGSCAIFKDHLLTNCCRGDSELFAWVWAWLAHIFQHPGDKPGTALVFRGGQGVGKSTVGEIIGSLMEDHYLLVDDPRYVTGNFNAHLESTILLQVDEGFWAGDKTAEGRLKGLVTARRQMIERKGVDPIPVENHCRLLLTSNEGWVVPAGLGERRFCVLDVGDLCRENHEYFAAMRKELHDGGRARLLFELLNADLNGIDLRSIPSTDALSDQVEASLDDAGRWWLEKLTDGEFSRGHGWPEDIAADELFKSFTGWCDQLGVRRRMERGRIVKRIQGLGTKLVRVRPRDEQGSRYYAYELPTLDRCRAALIASAPRLRPDWDSGPEGP